MRSFKGRQPSSPGQDLSTVELVEQSSGDDFVIAQPRFAEQFGGLTPAPRRPSLKLKAAQAEPEDGSLFDVTEIRRLLEVATDATMEEQVAPAGGSPLDGVALLETLGIGAGSIEVEDEAWEIPTQTMPALGVLAPSLIAGGTGVAGAHDEQAVESLFASFLRETEKETLAAPAPPAPAEPEAKAGPGQRGDMAGWGLDRTRPDRQRPRLGDPDLLEPPSAPAADPRLVALEMLDEAEIYRRFGHLGEAQQCVLRARQVCPGDGQVEVKARALLAQLSPKRNA